MIKVFEENNKLSWFTTIAVASIIFWVSSLTFGTGTFAIGINAILYHIVAFFFFTLFLLFSSTKGKKQYKIFLLVIIISIFYGITDEVHQFFVPGRNCGFFDLLLDSIGIFMASLFYLCRLLFLKNEKQPLNRTFS